MPAISAFESLRPDVVVGLLNVVAQAIRLPLGFSELHVEFENRHVRRYGVLDLRNGAPALRESDDRAVALLEALFPAR